MRTNLSVLALNLLKCRSMYSVRSKLWLFVSSFDGKFGPLKEAITAADAAAPSINGPVLAEEIDFNGGKPYFFLKRGEGPLTSNWGRGHEWLIEFRISHSNSDTFSLRRGQVYAYEKYLANLVCILRQKSLPQVTHVEARMEMEATIDP